MWPLGLLSVSTTLLSLWISVACGAKEPKVNKKTFDNLPQTYFYFDDSPVILFLEQETLALWRSEDDGASWKKNEEIPEKEAFELYQHPFEKEKAYLLMKTKAQYYTTDRGKNWEKFTVELPPSATALGFHADKPDWIIYTGMDCEQGIWGDWLCTEKSYYTKDGFKSDPKLLREKPSHGCVFARSTKIFKAASDNAILCVVDGDKPGAEYRRLLISDDFFEHEHEPSLDGGKKMEGIAGIAVIKKFIVAAVKSKGTDEMALFVTDDAEKWDRAQFPEDHGGLKQDAYTILESTAHSIQVDVLTTTSANPIGALFTSNSNGSYFVQNVLHTNRDREGRVDFEQVQGIQGIVLVNIVKNADELEKGRWNKVVRKKIESKISFDDGRNWSKLKTKDGDLHVHSVTKLGNGGRVFSSLAPGLLMAVGNTGDYLKDYTDGDLYVSDDAGLTWTRALTDAHRYEFGDSGSILIAVNDEKYTNEYRYSLNHGKDWEKASLGIDIEVRALALTTVQDSTSKKFTLLATEKNGKAYIFGIDFTGVLERKCNLEKDNEEKGDFEKWYARLDENGKPDCLMGHKEFFWRRKKDKDCFVDDEYKDPTAEREICPCTKEDYECDYNFRQDENGKCKLVGKRLDPDGACKKSDDKFMGSSGYRLIPGDDCDAEKGEKMDQTVEVPCSEVDLSPPSSRPSNGKIKSKETKFSARGFVQYYYLERKESSSGDDETIVGRTDVNEIFVTHNQGASWEQPDVFKKTEIIDIIPNPYINDNVYFLTPSKDVYLTTDRAKSFKKMEAPGPPTSNREIPAMGFHPTDANKIIWTTDKDCENKFSSSCHAAAYFTRWSHGEEWEPLLSYVRKCAWMQSDGLKVENMIFCEKYEKEEKPGDKNPLQLVSSDDFFAKKKMVNENVIGFATMSEFIIIAAVKEDGTSLKVDASIDGITFADAKFPPNFQVDRQQAYTVLDSITHAVFLHVTVNPRKGSEYGSILKSNSNGTSYVVSLHGANRNEVGYVDFEKMQGLEGVAIVNVVANTAEVDKGANKKLKTKITHNDGADWTYITPPEKNAKGTTYKCAGDLDRCSLHLHGYTERGDPGDTFSSGSAVGLMIGVGNVGEFLAGKKEGNTYLTRDGGITWREIRQGPYMWEYGDQGSIILIVDEFEPTDKVFYSLNEGTTWEEFSLDNKMLVDDITTVPSDTSRKFLLWGKATGSGERIMTVQIDFEGLTDKRCEQPKDGNDGDFEIWEPKHPRQANGCLFGHKQKYYRKIPDHTCYVGSRSPLPYGDLENCECDYHDFECDFNYERTKENICRLVKGVIPPDHEQACAANSSLVEWYPPSGYRRIPLDTCTGGKELDKEATPRPCPGHEEEFREKHGTSGVAIFFSVIFSLGAAAAIGYWIWTKWQSGFGAIRLGEDSSGQSPIVRYPVIIISGIVAIVVAIPAILGAIGGFISSKLSRPRRYTTRGSFARGQYSVVNTDEGELLGSDDEDDV